MRRLVLSALATASALTGCAERGPRGGAPCGIAALAGPTLLLSEFSTPQQTLSTPPATLPETLVARLAAGPAYPAFVGRVDTSWVIGVEGVLPENTAAEFGVLVLDQSGRARGVMLYEGASVSGAPDIGRVSMGGDAEMIPLIGIQLDPRKFEDPACPFFPDSVLP